MIYMSIENPDVDRIDEIECTSWQVSDSVSFTNIVSEILNSSEFLFSVYMDIHADVNKIYYGRCRVKTTTGWTKWSNVDIIPIDSYGVHNAVKDIPSVVNTPLITTDHNASQHPLTCFNIKVEGFDNYGSGKHVATNYWIEDGRDHTIVWASMNNELGKNETLMDNDILKGNIPYRIRSSFISSTGDISAIASKTIITGESGITILTNMHTVGSDGETYILLKETGNFKYEIYEKASGVYVLIYSVEDDNSHSVPEGVFKMGIDYILKIQNIDNLDTITRNVKVIF